MSVHSRTCSQVVASIDDNCIINPTGPDAQGEPQGQRQPLCPTRICKVANLKEINCRANSNRKVIFPRAQEPLPLQHRQPAPPRGEAEHKRPTAVCEQWPYWYVRLSESVGVHGSLRIAVLDVLRPFPAVEPGEEMLVVYGAKSSAERLNPASQLFFNCVLCLTGAKGGRGSHTLLHNKVSLVIFPARLSPSI